MQIQTTKTECQMDSMRLLWQWSQVGIELEIAGLRTDAIEFCSVKSEPTSTDQTSRLNEFIALELARVPEVDTIFTAFRNNVFYIWVVLERFEVGPRELIYELEQSIIDEFPMFEFDFYLIDKMGRNPKELISESIELVYQR